jgi:hypothetical protein
MRRHAKTPSAKAQAEADRLIQEVGKKKFPRSLISNEPTQVLHHFFPKSVSNRLRYDWDNLIPLTNAEHCRLHQSPDPEIESRIIAIKGKRWLTSLLARKRELIKTDRIYYETQISRLKEELQALEN